MFYIFTIDICDWRNELYINEGDFIHEESLEVLLTVCPDCASFLVKSFEKGSGKELRVIADL